MTIKSRPKTTTFGARQDQSNMIYRILKFIFSYAARKYFVRIHVVDEHKIPLDRPVLLLPNHRSAFMDPIVVATQIKRTTYFLTRGESFNNPLAVKIFKRLKMVPIFRKEHNPEKTDQNKDVFRYCYNLMKENGCMIIFPEGICQTKYTLAPIKTGAARIALGAEKENNFELDIHLVPVGINYSNPHRFRGSVTLNIGNPIRTRDYKNRFLANEWKTVKELSEAIDQGLRNEIIILDDQEQMVVVKELEHLMRHGEEAVSFRKEEWLTQRRTMIDVLNHAESTTPEEYDSFKRAMDRHFTALRRLGVRYRFDPDRTVGFRLGGNGFMRGLLLVIGFPFLVLGLLTHFLPFWLTRIVALNVVKRVDFIGSVVLALGVLFFTIFCGAETWLVHHYTHSWWATLVFFFAWPTLGLFTYGYLAELVTWVDGWTWRTLGKRKKELQRKLHQEREKLLNQFEGFSARMKAVDTTTSN